MIMRPGKPVLGFLILGFLATVVLSAERVEAQTGTNLVQNRARTDLLLNVQGGQPLATPASRGATTAHWSIEPAGEAGFVRLRNVGTGFHLHAEGGRLQAGAIQPDWSSAQWSLEYVDGNTDVRIKNRASGGYLHNTDGPLVVGPAAPDSLGLVWKLIPVGAQAQGVVPSPPRGGCSGRWLWRDGRYVCLRSCPPGYHHVGNVCHKTCPPGFHPKGHMCVKHCPPGFHPVGNVCVKNKPCPAGQHLSKGHCCPNGKNWNNIQKKCV
jgi:hypothetical protein